MGKPTKRITESRQVSVSKYAIQNINDIVKYIAFVNQQPRNAIKVNKAFEEAITKIAVHPFSYNRMRTINYQNKNMSPGSLSVMAHYL